MLFALVLNFTVLLAFLNRDLLAAFDVTEAAAEVFFGWRQRRRRRRGRRERQRLAQAA